MTSDSWTSNADERLRRYISSLEKALQEIEIVAPDRRYEDSARGVVDLAKRYFEDAKYYRDKGDALTGIVNVAYAEGLLDALRLMGFAKFSWRRSGEEKKVFVGGTFDIIHPGHIELLKFASRYGRVYVAVSRDSNAEKIKGRRPINNEYDRLRVIKAIRYTYDAFLGDERDFIKSVERVRPDIIVLGPDQFVSPEELRNRLSERGLGDIEIIKFPKRIEPYSSTEIIRRIVREYRDKEI